MNSILLIEDDLELSKNIIFILEMEGYGVEYTNSKSGALQLLNLKYYSLILCDIIIIGGTGFEVLGEYRKNLKGIAAPFIFITALNSRDDIRKGMELGADDYIPKPFTRDELLNSVRINLLKRKEITQRVSIISAVDELSQNKAVDLIEITHEKRLLLEQKLLIGDKNCKQFTLIRDIESISSFGDYTKLQTVRGQKYTIRKTMKEWENILPIDIFFRIHRSTIINSLCIEKVVSGSSGTKTVFLKNSDKRFIISQRNCQANPLIKTLLEKEH